MAATPVMWTLTPIPRTMIYLFITPEDSDEMQT